LTSEKIAVFGVGFCSKKSKLTVSVSNLFQGVFTPKRGKIKTEQNPP
jgi:hypothetical protein